MKTAVIYWSATGNTEAMAQAVLDGMKGAGADAEIFTCSQVSEDTVASFDAVAFGCPAMGAEELEEAEFLPMFESVKPALSGKKIGLFGSYDWGTGEWMEIWAQDCKDSGLDLVGEGVIANLEPDEEAIAKCGALGEALAS